MKKPLIGIVLDRETDGGYSEYPYYALREHYFEVITKAGGIPIGLDLNSDNITYYSELCDGLLMPGGDYDIPPERYGDTYTHEKTVTKVSRLTYDMEVIQAFLDVDRPVLGICVGQQLLTVMFGGTLIQDITSEVADSLEHYQGLRTEAVHEIEITKRTLLYKAIGHDKLRVNSHHHQAAKTVGPDMIVSAVSPDGIIEAVESTKHTFCLGVEWHPEFLIDDRELEIFKAFVRATRR